jgi:protein-tyrosine phosphatase
MPHSTSLGLTQQRRLEQFACARTVDVHCHILPGVDDGPRMLGDALRVAKAMVADGFTDVIATPHMLGRWDGTNEAASIRSAVQQFQAELDQACIPLSVHPGGEVRLDERIPALLGAGKILTLADRGVHLLLELPLGMQADPARLVPYLASGGMTIILAHAERCADLVADANKMLAWVRQGAAIQVNASSLLGDDPAAAAIWKWIDRGWVNLVGTDAHSVNTRKPRMSDAVEQIIKRHGSKIAKRLCIENPSRILDGQQLAAA